MTEKDGDHVAGVLERGDRPEPGGGFAFVGRRRELGLLLAAARHPPAVVMVEGEAGIGKSRLVHEAAGTLAAEDRPTITGACHPLREPFPYGPVVDALRRTGPLLPPAESIPPTAGALAPLLPDLADRLPPPLAPPDDPRGRRHQMVQAVGSLLGAIGPLMLVIEDLHWADEATRELLLLLARDLPEQLSLVLTYRAEDLPAGTPVLGSAYHRPPGVSGTSIRLTQLTADDVRDLAVAALGPNAATGLATVLYARSQGLPVVAEEDLITLLEHGADHHDLAARLARAEVPTGLREAVTERLNALPPAGGSIVAAAAVLAVPAPEPLLARIAGLDPADGADGLTGALHTSVLVESEAGRYSFRHTLAQQVAYRHIPGPQRRRLHERAIAELQTQSPPPLVQIAHHTLATGDREAWFQRAEEAVHQATAFGDTGTAATLLHQILEQPGLPGDLRSRAALTLARIAVNRADHTASADLLRRILADPQLPAAVRGEVRLGLGLLTINQAGDRSGFREVQQAAEELADRPEVASRAMVALAISEGDETIGPGWAWIERAEHALRDSQDEVAHAAVRATRLTLMARDGDPDVWQQLARLPREGGNIEVLWHTTRALFNTANCAIENGHDQRAGALLTECLQLGNRLGLPFFVCYGRFALIHLDAVAGRWAELEERLAALAAEYPDMALPGLEVDLILGQLCAARGQFSRALERLRSASANAEKQTQINDELRAAAALAGVRLAQDAPGDAFALAAPAVETLRRARTWARAAGLVPVAVEAALAIGERRFAEQLADDVEQGLAGRDAPAACAELAFVRGLLLEDTDLPAAAEQFARAHRRWQEIGRPYEVARAAERQARAVAAASPERAAALLGAALAEFTQLGATADAARCQHTLQQLGLAQPESRGGRGYGSTLSPREREVAELLARGATNQDIAQALFLSPRTVEKHVAHVLKKLGTTRKNVAKAFPESAAAVPE